MTENEQELQRRLGIPFRDSARLHLALVHRSYLHERPDEAKESNERLEFLGDAFLGFVIAAELYQRYPDKPEGWMSEARSSLVRMETLASIASSLGIGDCLLLGRGEEQSGGRDRLRNLARAFEAVIGAVYTDQGYLKARGVVLGCFRDRLPAVMRGSENYKSLLQEEVQARGQQPPRYVKVSEEGTAQTRVFTVAVRTDSCIAFQGTGSTLRMAEQSAAMAAYQALAPSSQE